MSRTVQTTHTTDAPFAVDLYGHGRVAKALRPLLDEGGIPLARVHTSRGIIESHDIVTDERILVDLTAPRYHGPHAWKWVGTLRDALRDGTTLVTANKAPLAIAWDRLYDAAIEGDAQIRCTATVGGGTPILPTLHRLRRSHGIQRIEASLSGTLSYVVERVARGDRLIDAVWAAQEAGFAEPDPALDLDGTDALAKAHILHRLAFPETELPLFSAGHQTLRLADGSIRELAAGGAVPAVIATIEPGSVRLALQGLSPGDPLAATPGQAVARFTTQDGSSIIAAGPGAGPETTARAVYGDLTVGGTKRVWIG